MTDLSVFNQFTVASKQNTHNKQGKGVIYTRVSTKEQADNNKSLETQKKYCEQLAIKSNIDIIEYFGGTYESAKSDERKEFTKMLSFVKRNKSVSYIIVYSYDRFSRTGANGAYISEQLKKQGVVTISATQKVDIDSASGSFQQNLYYMFSQFDNELRRDKSVTGMQEKLRKGHWTWKPPFGYVNLNAGEGKEPNIVVNADGKLLRLAFKWKAEENISIEEIAKRLEKKGLSIPSKRLGEYFKNPFYCGILVSSIIPNEYIIGKHELLIPKTVFLKVNDILKQNNHGYKQNLDDENLPLRHFIKSTICKTPYTGYVVKKKGLYYYKNNRKGSKENKSAKLMHQKFKAFLSNYQLNDKKYIEPFKDTIKYIFVEQHKEQIKEAEIQEKRLKEIENKLLRLEERYILEEEISKEQYDRFATQLRAEQQEIIKNLSKGGLILSNLEKVVEKALKYSLNLSNLWSYGTLEVKRGIQNLLFPEGILYDFKNDVYRTIRVNSIFNVIHSLSIELAENKKRGTTNYMLSPALVGPPGLEPGTF
tara:strand:- start:12 stop:1619 length:1608 start_codon:yes stop_codon:yes gene_type:complete